MNDFEKRTKLLKNERILIESYEDALAVGRKLDSLKETAINNICGLIGAINNINRFYFNIKDSIWQIKLLNSQKSVTAKQWLQRFPDYQPVMGDKVWVSESSVAKARKAKDERIFVKGSTCVWLKDEDNFINGYWFGTKWWKYIVPAQEMWEPEEEMTTEFEGKTYRLVEVEND